MLKEYLLLVCVCLCFCLSLRLFCLPLSFDCVWMSYNHVWYWRNLILIKFSLTSFLPLSYPRFDLTKVPDIYDMIRFDVLHNSHLEVRTAEALYVHSDIYIMFSSHQLTVCLNKLPLHIPYSVHLPICINLFVSTCPHPPVRSLLSVLPSPVRTLMFVLSCLVRTAARHPRAVRAVLCFREQCGSSRVRDRQRGQEENRIQDVQCSVRKD